MDYSKSTTSKLPQNDNLDKEHLTSLDEEFNEDQTNFKKSEDVSPDNKPIRADIERKLRLMFNPHHLEIIDESHKHAHHAAMKMTEGGKQMSASGETHFKVIIVSDLFDGKILIDRHRLVNECLAIELSERGVHALSIQAKTIQ